MNIPKLACIKLSIPCTFMPVKTNIMAGLTNIILLVFLAALTAGRGDIQNKKEYEKYLLDDIFAKIDGKQIYQQTK